MRFVLNHARAALANLISTKTAFAMRMKSSDARTPPHVILMLLPRMMTVRVCTLFQVTTVQVRGPLWVVWMTLRAASLALPHRMIQRCAIIRFQATTARATA